MKISLQSLGDKSGKRNGFSRNYSVELTKDEYNQLIEEDRVTLVAAKIKIPNYPTNTFKFIELYVPLIEYNQRRKQEQYEDELKEEKEKKDEIQLFQRIHELSILPRKTGEESYCFIKMYDLNKENLTLSLFGNYQVFYSEKKQEYTFVLKQLFDGREWIDVTQEAPVILHRDIVKLGYGDFADVTPDKIQVEVEENEQ